MPTWKVIYQKFHCLSLIDSTFKLHPFNYVLIGAKFLVLSMYPFMVAPLNLTYNGELL